MSTEEKVEMEAVPLKTDTDETKPETAETAVDKKEAPKKTWFFQKTEKKKVIEEEEGETKEKTKKKCFWRCQKEKKEGEEEEQKQEMSIGIDMQMRDEKQLNDHVKIQFEDVFGEPDSFHSFDCVWKFAHRVFEGTRTGFYKFFAFIFVLPATLLFGFLFALFSSFNTFVVVPLAVLAKIPLTWIAKAWSFLISCACDPVANSLGLCFSKVQVRKYGINSVPTDLIQA